MVATETPTPEVQAKERAQYLTGLMWHAGTFVIINAFFWILDAWTGSGVNWSILVTAFWGFALAFHALAYWIDGRQVEERKTADFLRQQREREESA